MSQSRDFAPVVVVGSPSDEHGINGGRAAFASVGGQGVGVATTSLDPVDVTDAIPVVITAEGAAIPSMFSTRCEDCSHKKAA